MSGEQRMCSSSSSASSGRIITRLIVDHEVADTYKLTAHVTDGENVSGARRGVGTFVYYVYFVNDVSVTFV